MVQEDTRGGTKEAKGHGAAQEIVRGAAQEGTVQEIVDVVDRIMRHKAQSRTQSGTQDTGCAGQGMKHASGIRNHFAAGYRR